MPLLVLFISLLFFHFVVKPPREGFCTTVRLDHRLQGLRMPISSSWAGVRGSRVVGYRVKCGVDPLSFFRCFVEKSTFMSVLGLSPISWLLGVTSGLSLWSFHLGLNLTPLGFYCAWDAPLFADSHPYWQGWASSLHGHASRCMILNLPCLSNRFATLSNWTNPIQPCHLPLSPSIDLSWFSLLSKPPVLGVIMTTSS